MRTLSDEGLITVDGAVVQIPDIAALEACVGHWINSCDCSHSGRLIYVKASSPPVSSVRRMFCYQCEQTDHTADPNRPNLLTFGCASQKGNCGKDATTAALQDVPIHVDLGIGQYRGELRQPGAPDAQYAAHASFDLFTTLTNVNFNTTRFMSLIADAVAVREQARQAYEAAARAAGKEPETLTGAAQFVPATTVAEVRRAGSRRSAWTPTSTRWDPTWWECATSTCTASRLSARIPITRTSSATTPTRLTPASSPPWRSWQNRPPTPTPARHALELRVHQLPSDGDARRGQHRQLRRPVPTPVRVTPVVGKAILVSGHDLGDLKKILEATEGHRHQRYTHGEMPPAHGYPGLHKYSHLAGNYGGAWPGPAARLRRIPGSDRDDLQLPDRAAAGLPPQPDLHHGTGRLAGRAAPGRRRSLAGRQRRPGAAGFTTGCPPRPSRPALAATRCSGRRYRDPGRQRTARSASSC